MLTPEQRELITAAVDGELSATEARACLQLLETSADARSLHIELMALSRRVRLLPLPQAAPPIDLRAKIMARVAASTPVPALPRKKQPAPTPKTMPAPLAHPASPAPTPVPARRAIPSWLPVAVAASVLICVAAGSFAYFTTPGSTPAKNPWAHALPAPQESPTAVPSPTQTPPQVQTPSDPHAVAHIDLSPVPVLPLPKEVVPEGIAIAPEPRPSQHEILGSRPLPPIPPFDIVQVRVPFLRAIAELEREDIRLELRDELATPLAAYRLDLFARDTARGVTLFQTAAKAAGLTVFADAATLDKLKKRQAHAVVIYVECLTAEELAVLFSKVSAEDKKVSPRVFDSLHAMPTLRHDENELKAILGQDVGLYKRPVGSNGTGQGSQHNLLDKDGNPRPVSAGTIDTVTKSLTTPPAKPGEKPAVLMTWQTTHPTNPSIGRTPPNTSVELKQFLAKRGDRKPNAVPAIIVIRPVG